MKKRYWFLSLAAIIFIIGSVALPDLIYSSAIKVNTVEVSLKDVNITKNVTGKICTYGEQEIYAQTDCIIEKVYAKTGDYLKKGEKIAKINKDATKKLILKNSNPDYAAARAVSDYITMPQNGRISKTAESMQIISGESICTIITDSSLYLALNISEAVISDIEQSDSLTFSGAAFSGSYDGILSEISPVAQAISDQSSAVIAAAKIKSPNEQLKSGYTVDAKITTDTLKAVMCLPQDAVLQDKNGSYVFVYENGSAIKTNVTVRCYCEGSAVIDSGVKVGQTVISDAAKCKDGAKVIVKNGD